MGATIDENGVITAISAGTTEIFAIDTESGLIIDGETLINIFNEQNVSDRTYAAMSTLNQFRVTHNIVAMCVANIVGGTYKMEDNKINKGNNRGTYFGYADVLKDTGGCTYIWEIKHAKDIYNNIYYKLTTNDGLAVKQVNRYINASRLYPQSFTTPLLKGNYITSFVIPHVNGQYLEVQSAGRADEQTGIVFYHTVDVQTQQLVVVPEMEKNTVENYRLSSVITIDTSFAENVVIQSIAICVVAGVVIVGAYFLCESTPVLWPLAFCAL